MVIIPIFIQRTTFTHGLGPCGEARCSSCNTVAPFDLFFYATCVTLSGSAGMVTDRSYYRHCRQCGVGEPVDQRDVDPRFKVIQIPFMLRYGFFVALVMTAIIAGTIVWSVVAFKPRRNVELPPASSIHRDDFSPDKIGFRSARADVVGADRFDPGYSAKVSQNL
jgi:hypothetical protein